MRPTGLYQRLVRADRSNQSEQEQHRIAHNGLRHVGSDALQQVGDQVVNAKTVLPWVLAAVGAPTVFTALLVPVRESGSMLPQAAMAPVLQRVARRKKFWLWGAGGQAVAAAGMALTVAVASGWLAGLGVVLFLALFSLARSLNSLAGKDVLGRTVPKGERGQISGLTTVLSGAVAITLGLGIRLLGGDGAGVGVLAVLLGVAALAWLAALAVFATIMEPPAEVAAGAAEAADGPTPARTTGWVGDSWALLRDDAPFRRFVIARGLLLVSALSPPFVVVMATREGDAGLAGLGPFVIASGLAGLVGGRVFGRLADRSSQQLLTAGAIAASVLVLAFLGLHRLEAVRESWWLYPVTFLLLALAHTGVRVARKTYVVDMAGDEKRTAYVAVSNTAIGVVLLVAGAVSGALALLGPQAALLFLAAAGLLSALVSRSLPDVSASSATT
ncbi:MFS transporter [Ornithinimicrobium panacihumi]|uniref:MFS transporter n=1 Tax=Ornithinimicrobium panacihumi TaxID=2008449 RepID=UPI003F89E7D4